MSKKFAAWMGVSVVAMLTLTACDNGKSANAEQPVVTLARAEPAPVIGQPEGVETTSAEVKRGVVTYKDAETVFRKGHYEEAKELFSAYVETKPDDMQGQYMLGLSAWKSGEHKIAEAALRRELESIIRIHD